MAQHLLLLWNISGYLWTPLSWHITRGCQCLEIQDGALQCLKMFKTSLGNTVALWHMRPTARAEHPWSRSPSRPYHLPKERRLARAKQGMVRNDCERRIKATQFRSLGLSVSRSLPSTSTWANELVVLLAVPEEISTTGLRQYLKQCGHVSRSPPGVTAWSSLRLWMAWTHSA